MIIIKALYDLKAGIEITHPYINPGQENNLKSWGIKKWSEINFLFTNIILLYLIK